jgi:putative membrane protein
MARKNARTRERSLIKGALAGLVGGIVGSGVKTLAEKILPPRVAGQAAPPAALAERVAGHPLSEVERQVAVQAFHWSFGAVAGAVYGIAVEMEPKAAVWRGAAFGLTLNKLTHESLLPKMGLAAPTVRQRTRERQSEWISHAVYGVATEAVRRLVRKGL